MWCRVGNALLAVGLQLLPDGLIAGRAGGLGLTILVLDLEHEVGNGAARLLGLVADRDVTVLVDLVDRWLDDPVDEVGRQLVFARPQLERFAQPRQVERAVAEIPVLSQQLVDAHSMGAGHVADLLQLVGRELNLQARDVLDDLWREHDLDVPRAVDVRLLADPTRFPDSCLVRSWVGIVDRHTAAVEGIHRLFELTVDTALFHAGELFQEAVSRDSDGQIGEQPLLLLTTPANRIQDDALLV